MPKDNTENKDQVKESQSKSKKSTYSKKKKNKKNILNGIAYVQSTFNNTIVSIADTNGNVISWASAGQKGFKGSRKSTPYAAQVAADAAESAAIWAAYGVDFLEPLKPFCPAEAHDITLPFVSAIEIIVLLKVDCTYAIPFKIFFLVFFFFE